MENLIFSLDATLPVFLVMVAGGILGRLGFLPKEFCKACDKLTFKITLPIMLFLDMAEVDMVHDFEPKFVLFCAGATLVSILVIWALARVLVRDKSIIGEFVQASYRSSAAVLGVAFIQNIYGDAYKQRQEHDLIAEKALSESGAAFRTYVERVEQFQKG